MALAGLSDNQLTQLQKRLEEGVERLSSAFPMALAVVAVRDPEGQILTVAGQVASHLDGLVEDRPPVTEDAFEWVQINRTVLTLTVGAKLRVSDLYQPLIELGLESGMVAPVFHEDRLLGVLVVASRHVGGYTPEEVRRVRNFADSLIPCLAPAPPAAAPHEPEKPSIADLEARLRQVARQLVGQTKPRSAEPAPNPPAPPNPRPEPAPAPRPDAHAQTPSDDTITLRVDALGRVRSWDPRAEKLFGWRADEVIGKFLTLLVRDDARNVLDIRFRERLLAQGPFVGRTVSWRRDGSPIVCKISLSRVADEPDGLTAFIGRIEAVPASPLIPHEPVELGFAELYDFSKRLS